MIPHARETLTVFYPCYTGVGTKTTTQRFLGCELAAASSVTCFPYEHHQIAKRVDHMVWCAL
jgi:hypothetical protein